MFLGYFPYPASTIACSNLCDKVSADLLTAISETEKKFKARKEPRFAIFPFLLFALVKAIRFIVP